MQIEEWRNFLYPFGYFASIFFSARFILQWIQSEKSNKSIVTLSFWKLSLAGNVFLFLHAFVQSQFYVCLVQLFNAIISKRNLDLIQKKNMHVSFNGILKRSVIVLSIFTIFFVCLHCSLEDNCMPLFFTSAPLTIAKELAPVTGYQSWHLIGLFGYLLFSSRFWVQWWISEKRKESVLSISFWWMSFVGALISSLYFAWIRDYVNLIGPLMGLVPYFRNIVLIYRKQPNLSA